MLYANLGRVFGEPQGWAVGYGRSVGGWKFAAKYVEYAVEKWQLGRLGELEVENDPP